MPRNGPAFSFGKSITFQHVGGASPASAHALASSLPGNAPSFAVLQYTCHSCQLPKNLTWTLFCHTCSLELQDRLLDALHLAPRLRCSGVQQYVLVVQAHRVPLRQCYELSAWLMQLQTETLAGQDPGSLVTINSSTGQNLCRLNVLGVNHVLYTNNGNILKVAK